MNLIKNLQQKIVPIQSKPSLEKKHAELIAKNLQFTNQMLNARNKEKIISLWKHNYVELLKCNAELVNRLEKINRQKQLVSVLGSIIPDAFVNNPKVITKIKNIENLMGIGQIIKAIRIIMTEIKELGEEFGIDRKSIHKEVEKLYSLITAVSDNLTILINGLKGFRHTLRNQKSLINKMRYQQAVTLSEGLCFKTHAMLKQVDVARLYARICYQEDIKNKIVSGLQLLEYEGNKIILHMNKTYNPLKKMFRYADTISKELK